MEKTCKVCKHGKGVNTAFVDVSLQAQEEMKQAKAKVAGQGKAIRLIVTNKVIAKQEYGKHREVHGALSLSKKPTDEDNNYIICSNEKHLKDEKAHKNEIIHKYYFSCPYFEGAV